MVDEDLAHHASGDTEEVGTVLPVLVVMPEQPQIGLMYEGGGLKGVIAALAPHVGAGGSTQFSLDGLEEPLALVRRAAPPSPEHGREVVS